MDATTLNGKRPRAQEAAAEEEDGGGGGGGGVLLLPWHNPAARICRVSRASGGKDRHSKVLTAKGLRDRRVRLSVATAIQFYDLQDRLGYDQPSKAVEWLIRAASAAIDELPSLDGAFAALSGRLAAAGRGDRPAAAARSACSSNSETSKGSVLSLPRSETRRRARERAMGSTEGGDPPDRGCSFTDLLTGSSGNNLVTVAQADAAGIAPRHALAVTTADYFGEQKLPVIAQFAANGGGVMPLGFAPLAARDHVEIQHNQLPLLLQDHLVPVAAVANGGEYNLGFSMSSGLAGFNRGTLQSNSPSLMAHLHHLQRFAYQTDGSSLPFLGAAVPAASVASGEHLFPSGIDGRLHMAYGDAYRHSDLKGKGKN